MYKREINKELLEKVELLSKKMEVDSSFLINYLTSRNRETKRRDRTFNDLFCGCGNPRSVVKRKNGSFSLYPACENPECRRRPLHSKKMKELASLEDTPLTGLMKKGKLHNKNVNTFEFRKKVLENKGINIKDNEVNKMFSDMLSKRNKKKENRVSVMLAMIQNFSPDCRKRFKEKYPVEVNRTFIMNLPDEEFSKFKFLVWGLNTLSIPSSSNRNSFYRRAVLCGLKYNKKGLTAIQTKSGYEEKYIKFFERRKIPWSYEEFLLETSEGGTYNPDFVVEVFGEKWVIEVKGSLFRQGKAYIENKLIPAVSQCKKRGYNFCLTFEGNPRNWDFLQKTNEEELKCLLLSI